MKIVGVTGFGRFVGVKVGVANFFLGQSIDIDENNTYEISLRVTGIKIKK